MTTNEIVGRLKAGGLEASSTNRGAAVYVTDATGQRATPGWFGFRIICNSEATERRVRSILSRFYYIEASGNVWRLKSRNLVPLMAIKRGGVPPTPPTPSGNYLYFEAKQANSTVSMMSTLTTAPNLEYSTDGGTTWQTWNSTQQDIGEGMMAWVFDTITLGAVGDKVHFKGVNDAMSDTANSSLSAFIPTGNVKVGGSVQSLVDGTGESTTAIEMFSLFNDIMSSGALTEVESGLLPATTLADNCYYNMFSSCTSLTTAPALPATTLVDSCYSAMFYGCSSLNSVTCLATDISATDCLTDWLTEVAASGTLYKAPAMTGWMEGTNYPSGWTLTDYSA